MGDAVDTSRINALAQATCADLLSLTINADEADFRHALRQCAELIRALLAERDELAAQVLSLQNEARAADERCARYDVMVAERDAEIRMLKKVARIAYTFSFPDDSNDHLTDKLFEDLCGALDALPPGMLEGER